MINKKTRVNFENEVKQTFFKAINFQIKFEEDPVHMGIEINSNWTIRPDTIRGAVVFVSKKDQNKKTLSMIARQVGFVLAREMEQK